VRVTPTIATLTLALGLALTANACGSHAPPKPVRASTRSHASAASATPSPTASPSATASDKTTLPAGAAYDKILGGAFQVVDWRVSDDRRKVIVMLAARDPAVRIAARLQSAAGRVDVELSDTRVQKAAAAKADESGRGDITAARFVFPPDDSLVMLRLRTADTTATPSADLSETALTGRFLALTVVLHH
jgi:hypothetical protein